MLFLLFQLGEDRYAIEATRIVEILPQVRLKAIPHAPAGIAGVFNYRGDSLPVVDLSQWTSGRPAAPLMSTRLVIVRDEGEAGCRFAVRIERATEMLRRDPGEFKPAGIETDAGRYLGPVVAVDTALVQWIDLGKLLPPAVRDAIFSTAEDAP